MNANCTLYLPEMDWRTCTFGLSLVSLCVAGLHADAHPIGNEPKADSYMDCWQPRGKSKFKFNLSEIFPFSFWFVVAKRNSLNCFEMSKKYGTGIFHHECKLNALKSVEVIIIFNALKIVWDGGIWEYTLYIHVERVAVSKP